MTVRPSRKQIAQLAAAGVAVGLGAVALVATSNANAATTGTGPSPADTTTSSTTTSSTAPAQVAPTFGTPSTVVVHLAYSSNFANVGSPAATYKVYDNKPNGTSGTTPTLLTPTVASNGDTVYTLNDGLVFDTKTGTVSASAAALTSTDSSPDSYTFVANNGVGGAQTANPTNNPPVLLHDVDVTATFPVLFSDVALGSTFAKPIYTLADAGQVGGFGDGTFRGGDAVSRQAFAHFIAGVLNKGGKTVPEGACDGTASKSAFSDVSDSNPFCQEIASLASMGIVNGYSNGTFQPANNISRQAEAAYIYRVDEAFRNVDPKTGGDAQCTTPIPFNDVTAKNPFCGDIEWANKNNITKGYSDGGFHPAQNSSRQASVTFLYNLEILEKEISAS